MGQGHHQLSLPISPSLLQRLLFLTLRSPPCKVPQFPPLLFSSKAKTNTLQFIHRPSASRKLDFPLQTRGPSPLIPRHLPFFSPWAVMRAAIARVSCPAVSGCTCWACRDCSKHLPERGWGKRPDWKERQDKRLWGQCHSKESN